MKKFACLAIAVLGLMFTAQGVNADGWRSSQYGGYQPWWNIFAKRNPYMSVEEERLQRFWHDYYDSLKRYYGMLDRIDWVAYYKNHGYQINAGGGGGGHGGGSPSRVQFAPVFVSPQMQWATPSAHAAAPSGPTMPFMPAYPSYGPGPGPMPGPMPGPYGY